MDVGRAACFFSDGCRYDLMSDMEFGGGSEQMRDGDQDSVWALMEQDLV